MVPTLLVCIHRRLGSAGSCGAGGGEDLTDFLRSHPTTRELGWKVMEAGCLGHCTQGPNVKLSPAGPILHRCRADQNDALIDRLLAAWPPELGE